MTPRSTRRFPRKRTSAPSLVPGLAAAFVVGAATFGPTGCSSSDPTPVKVVPACDSSKCNPGNKCISDGTETKCRLLCQGQSGCPANYHCKGGSPDSYCVADRVAYAASDKGQWGEPCNPTLGIDKNTDCDLDQNFWCYAATPTDGRAYCTQFLCIDDSDCAGGYYCATINTAPNAIETKRSFGQTVAVCAKRDYCAPCASDIDCPRSLDGRSQFCAIGGDGKTFCSPSCETDDNCPLDSECRDLGDGTLACFPRAGTCVGDGSLCSPCRNDNDCPKGACLNADFSSEKFCSVLSTKTCTATEKGDCPAAATSQGSACITSAVNPDLPKNSCVGLVQQGVDDQGKPVRAVGCWTRDRKRSR
ncbi:MAG: hypothetical protein U0169_15180 [Polyangiaceae bacterium]